MRILIVEDDIPSARLLERLLTKYGKSDIAFTGPQALEAFKYALEIKDHYDVIFLDILLPSMNGQTVLKEIRSIEESEGIMGFDCVKVIMATGMNDNKSVFEAFRSQCEGYLIKPLSYDKIEEQLLKLGLIQKT